MQNLLRIPFEVVKISSLIVKISQRYSVTNDITISVYEDDVIEPKLFGNLKGKVILRILGRLPNINDMESLADKIVLYLAVETNNFDGFN